MKSYLINEEKYGFLKELGLQEVNAGVFSKHGRWFGDGEVNLNFILNKFRPLKINLNDHSLKKIDSICPANNKPIAAVVQVKSSSHHKDVSNKKNLSSSNLIFIK